MFRTVLIATLFVTSVLTIVPTGAASCSNLAQERVRGGGKLPFEDDANADHIDCCAAQTITIPTTSGTTYLSIRQPVGAKTIGAGPHVNNRFVAESLASPPTGSPRGGFNAWLRDVETNGLPAVFGFFSPVDPGDEVVAVRSPAAVVWIYAETNGVPGLQRGGSGALGTDGCRDRPYDLPPDAIVL